MFDDLVPERQCFLQPVFEKQQNELSVFTLSIQAENIQLAEVVNPQQRIAATDRMVEEGERLVLRQRQEPQGQLSHLDCQRVLVHAVQAALGDDTAGERLALVRVERNQLLVQAAFGGQAVRRDADQHRLALVLVEHLVLLAVLGLAFAFVPGFHESVGKIAAGLDEERRRAAGHIPNLEIEEFLGGAELPFLFRLALGGAVVDQRLQGVADDGFGQAGGRVVGAGRTPVGSLGDVDASLANHDRLAEGIGADQVRKGERLLEERVVVATSGSQSAGVVGFDCFLQGVDEGAL